MLSPMDGVQFEAHACQNLPMVLPTDAEKPIRACSGAQFPTDFKNMEGFFKFLRENQLNTDGI
jgi:hypothetical protein